MVLNESNKQVDDEDGIDDIDQVEDNQADKATHNKEDAQVNNQTENGIQFEKEVELSTISNVDAQINTDLDISWLLQTAPKICHKKLFYPLK